MFRFAPSLRSSPAWLRDWAGAWVFYSVLPPWPWIQPQFERIARFAPLVGVVLGGLQALFWILTSGWMPLMAQVPLVLALAVLLSGGLHLDGAMDTADGLAAGPRRCLEAMDDSRVGASGVQAVLLLLLVRSGALALLVAQAPAALVWAAVWGRLAPLVAMQAFPYLRADAGTAAFHRAHWRGWAREFAPSLLLLGLLSGVALGLGWPAWAGLGWCGLLPALLVPWALGRRLGGHSGDSYGACVEWTHTWCLLLWGVLLLLSR